LPPETRQWVKADLLEAYPYLREAGALGDAD
jgi:hypothetical protein